MAVTGSVGGLADPMKLFADALGMLMAPLNSVVEAFTGLAATVAPFVQALSPGTMQVFNIALRDLQATIGVALLPIIQVLTEGLHNAAGILLPAMQAMAPIVSKLAQAFMESLLVAVQHLSNMLIAWAPVLEVLVVIFRAYTDLVSAINVIFQTLVQTIVQFIASLLGGQNVKDVMSKFREIMSQAIAGLIKFAATLAVLVGMTKFVENLKENLAQLNKPPEFGAGGAAQNIGLKGFEQISRDLAVAAAAAVAPGTADKEKSWQDYVPTLMEDIDKIAEGKNLKQIIKELIPDVAEAIAKAVKGGGQHLVDEAKENAAGVAARAARGAARAGAAAVGFGGFF